MIKSLRDATMADGLPRVLREQPWVMALSAALGQLHRQVMEFADDSQVFTGLDTAPEAVLDAVAASWNIAWYDTGYTVEQKRRIVKSAITVRKMIGTAEAVKLQLNAVWPGTQVKEWFEYGGEPGCFRVESENPELLEDPERFLAALDAVKRFSAQLDTVNLRRRYGLKLRTGFLVRTVRKITVGCEIPELETVYLTDERGNTLVNERDDALTV